MEAVEDACGILEVNMYDLFCNLGKYDYLITK